MKLQPGPLELEHMFVIETWNNLFEEFVYTIGDSQTWNETDVIIEAALSLMKKYWDIRELMEVSRR